MARKKKTTVLQAVRKFCQDCIYDPGVSGRGTMHEQIEACTDIKCALYEHRPLTSKTKKADRQLEIEAMSPEELILHQERVEQARIRFGKLQAQTD